MSTSYSSDSEIDHYNPHRKRVRWSNHRTSLHSIFGGGKVADILLWTNKKLSASILICLTTLWFLFEIAEYHFVTLVCYSLLFLMVAIFVSFRMAWLINWNPPDIEDIKLSASACRSFFIIINWLLVNFYEISTGQDLGLFFMAICSIWLLSIIGNHVSTFNLFYIVALCLESLPALYERHKMELDNLAIKLYRGLKIFYMKFDRTVLDKIPRGPVKEKKFY